ncbi:MAG: LysM peptidoglycan-binding domain-containing protein [Pseudanabaena sp. M135S2SP2A07QC]|jgi:nucleoid-associated protein YgaU|nr:LysM peptidoglycan-binding domain-containing protein [Pseudanabaena sp. M090S1SP2A07QC]MCA6506198.1 LysM peptidoglycan-binding domain-containing protein [Pseudanabaena sp. M172S2SP2A07QC]MCA6521183.1 LysM peptidoglycan-binding domain-containing protein [Pseudanabaena sp. M051S1SP2A07QC]MCA6526301.1 LysM peptidoglycan-binding domain-containing protein [Pseudanabaena sp. M179S2SP2A07QC]MCA6529160.1 LysM peptidoglycan-binding domain-containing protein [Pseudanabaena sp. M125S2SP2A07QC]MCA65332
MTESIRIDCPVCGYQLIPQSICPNCDNDVSLQRSLLELPILQAENDTTIENIQNVPKESKLPKIWLLVLLGIAIGFVIGGWTGYSIFQSITSSRISEKVGQATPPVIISSPIVTSSPKTLLPQTYTVQTGDALETLALRFCENDLAWRDLVNANPSLVGRQNELEVGEKLNIPTNCKGK